MSIVVMLSGWQNVQGIVKFSSIVSYKCSLSRPLDKCRSWTWNMAKIRLPRIVITPWYHRCFYSTILKLTFRFQPRILSWICFMVKTCNEPKRMNQFTQNYIFVELVFWVLEGDFFLQEVSPIKYVNTNGRTIKLNLNLEWRVFAVEAPNRALDFNTCQTFSQAITKQNAHAHNIQAQWPY